MHADCVTIEDLPADLIGLVVELQAPFAAIRFSTITPSVTRKVAQTIALWDVGGFFDTREWELGEPMERELLKERNDFLADVRAVADARWSFRLHVGRGFVDADAPFISESLQQVTALHFSKRVKVSESSMEHVAKLQLLSTLEISSWHVGNEGVRRVAAGAPKLRRLKLSSVYGLTDQGVAHLAEGHKELRSLNILWNHKISDAGVLAICESMTKLTALGFSQCDSSTLTDNAVAHMSQLRHLQYLDISSCSTLSNGIFEHLPSFPQLTWLDISTSHFTHTKLTEWGLSQLSRCRLLETLKLQRHALSDTTLEALATLPKLTALDLQFCDGVSGDAARRLLDASPSLQVIETTATKFVRDCPPVRIDRSRKSAKVK